MATFKTQTLICHPASTATDIRALTVELSDGPAGEFLIRYQLHADTSRLGFPAPQSPGVADGLWQHTCFELFVAADGEAGYDEFNFSPSGQWAHYRFTRYRQRDEGFTPLDRPEIRFQLHGDICQLDAMLPPKIMPGASLLHIGLTAVIESTDGSKSYWALTHDAPQPDFHRRRSFTLPLNRSPS